MTGLRELIRENIAGVLYAFDGHAAGIYAADEIGTEEDRYACDRQKCGFVGTQSEWCDHLADKLADALEAK